LKSSHKLVYTFILILFLFLAACGSNTQRVNNSNLVSNQPLSATLTPFQPLEVSLFIDPGVPQEWRTLIETIESVSITSDLDKAALIFGPHQKGIDQASLFTARIIYAVAVPFMSVDDDISIEELLLLWKDSTGGSEYATLIVTEDTYQTFTAIWGQAGDQVTITSTEDLVSTLEVTENAVAILPFDQITPRCKILKIAGKSPLDKPFDEASYPLVVTYTLTPTIDPSTLTNAVAERFNELIPLTNRDESKMTVIVMSGTTAMARCTASKILLKGTDYPIEMVKQWFQTADLRHVSNEVAFSKECPRSDTCNETLQLCAHPEAIEVLEKLGVNVVELTGNHENDYGTESYSETLKMYADRGWYVFGGGVNQEEAKKPILIENNGNKIAFIGCNPVGFSQAWATEDGPGAARCDYDYMYSQIEELKKQGYVVISTFQHNEVYVYMYSETYREDFWNAAKAGADIVQGSQAHFPMGFEFINDSLIHYGLGNFLFDQMDIPVVGTKREFIDRHIIYDGKYINTEVLTALLTDWSRPVPMDEKERAQLLTDIFEASKKRFP